MKRYCDSCRIEFRANERITYCIFCGKSLKQKPTQQILFATNDKWLSFRKGMKEGNDQEMYRLQE